MNYETNKGNRLNSRSFLRSPEEQRGGVEFRGRMLDLGILLGGGLDEL